MGNRMASSRERDFTEFYDATWQRTVACAYAMTGILSDAEDLAQELGQHLLGQRKNVRGLISLQPRP